MRHNDREIEFHDLRDEAMERFEQRSAEVEHRSCEMMATDLASALAQSFDRPFTVSVFEDGEVGAEVTVGLDLSAKEKGP